MTDTTTAATAPRRPGSLSALRLAELQALATSMGITGTARMRKSDLISAIKAQQSGDVVPPRTAAAEPVEPAPARAAEADIEPARAEASRTEIAGGQGPALEAPNGEARNGEGPAAGRQRGRRRSASAPTQAPGSHDVLEALPLPEPRQEQGEVEGADTAQVADTAGAEALLEQHPRTSRRARQREAARGQREGERGDGADHRQGGRADREAPEGHAGEREPRGEHNGAGAQDDDERGGRRRRNRGRGRDKRQGRGREEMTDEPTVSEDDVLIPVAGILDVLDNYAFVRTSGYLAGPNDVYVPLGMVKRNGLRKGDAVTGAVKAAVDGDQQQPHQGGRGNRQKYNPLVRLDSINGMTAEEARKRPEFGKLTPLYPQERLRLETEQNQLTTRVIDLVAPIGKGQRGLIVAPAKAGKTMVMQAIANAITTNNPECHLMVVLVDERPEEVTDMSRAVKGEVISSTFDRPADDHTTVAELAIERAKRLVEMGHDVVVLLDSITKLGRAYNLAAPASGRILSGGVDSAALYPPKKFFGAARNIENGGSLTILATALVETGSRMDEVIFEEFKGTGNMELRLSRELANRRIFPAVDVNASGTRREEILLGPDELKITWKLRRVLSALDPQASIELILSQLRKTKSNYEFLVQVQQTSALRTDDEKKSD